jgi:Ser/Thr protein kinase RdoA (MazF antagonist)
MAGDIFDFFVHHELPAPTLGVEDVRRLMRETFGLQCDVTELGSQQDQNFLILDDENTAPIGVLKLSNPAFSETEIELQDLAAKTVAAREPALRIPQVVTGPRGPMSAWCDTSQGRIHGRVIQHVAGATLMGSGYLSPATVARMGELAAKVSVALSDVRHPASARVLQWDLRHDDRVIAALLPGETDTGVRKFAAAVGLAPASAARSLRHHRRQRGRGADPLRTARCGHRFWRCHRVVGRERDRGHRLLAPPSRRPHPG